MSRMLRSLNQNVTKDKIKKVYSGDKSKKFIRIKDYFKNKGIPKNLIFDTDLNVLRLQPSKKLKAKGKLFWKSYKYNDPKFFINHSKYQKDREKLILTEIKKLHNVSKILDFGCSNYLFLEKVKRKLNSNLELFGFDLNTKIVSTNRLIKKLTKKDLNKKNFYDLITLNWVISNSFEPFKIIDICRKNLKQRGYLILTESNVIMNDKMIKKTSEYFKMNDIHINQFVRPFHFTKFDIKNLLEVNNFKVLKCIQSNNLNCKIFVAKKMDKVKSKLFINQQNKFIKFINNFFGI